MPEPRNQRCEICNNPATHRNEDGIFCDECYNLLFFRCEECGQWHRILGRSTLNGRRLCRPCYEQHVGTCDRCGNNVDRDSLHQYAGQNLCRDCYRNVRSEGVCGYHHHHYQSFYDHELRLGFELETGDNEYDAYQDVVRGMNDIWEQYGRKFNMEHDGSIPDYGFETISHPFKLEEYNNEREYWDRVMKNLKDGGMKATKECGLHIHASRSFMEMSRWILVGWLIVKNKSKFEALARRRSCGYAQYADCISFSDYDDRSRNCRDHYDAINYGSSKPTVEFRMFASTTNSTTLYEDLELIDSLARFVKDANPTLMQEIAENPAEAFIKYKAYVAEKHYNNALNLIRRKGV